MADAPKLKKLELVRDPEKIFLCFYNSMRFMFSLVGWNISLPS